MMMQMLSAGGLKASADSLRTADDSNPRGYFELGRVKALATDNSWVRECQGQALKVVSPLLFHLPNDLDYKIVFMDRPMSEILASQTTMMARLGKGPVDPVKDNAGLREYFADHLDEVNTWLRAQARIQVRHVSYHRCIDSPRDCAELVRHFIGLPLDVASMAACVESKLYRERTNPQDP